MKNKNKLDGVQPIRARYRRTQTKLAIFRLNRLKQKSFRFCKSSVIFPIELTQTHFDSTDCIEQKTCSTCYVLTDWTQTDCFLTNSTKVKKSVRLYSTQMRYVLTDKPENGYVLSDSTEAKCKRL